MSKNRIHRDSVSRGLRTTLTIGLLLATAPAFANVKSLLPDFYAEPGLNPFRDQVSANVTEHIDPFSGTLMLAYTDLVIPGNGGFDIKIRRTCNLGNIYQMIRIACKKTRNRIDAPLTLGA